MQDDGGVGCWDDGCGGNCGVLMAGWPDLNRVMKGGWCVAVMYPTATMIDGKALVTIIKVVIWNRRAVPNEGVAVSPDENVAYANGYR